MDIRLAPKRTRKFYMHPTYFKVFSPSDQLTSTQKEEITDFLYVHLGEYGDEKSAIMKSIDYAMGENGKPGGIVIMGKIDGELLGVVVVNKTGMEEYIPENILVYIAVHQKARGQGIGKKLLDYVFKMVEGDIALHCEPENPARLLYEKMGFSSKYMEMRKSR